MEGEGGREEGGGWGKMYITIEADGEGMRNYMRYAWYISRAALEM